MGKKKKKLVNKDSCIVCAGRHERRKEGMPLGMFKSLKNMRRMTSLIERNRQLRRE